MQNYYRALIGKIYFILLITFIVVACKPTPVMTEIEKKAMDNLTHNMQTHCVGRYLIDIPSSFKVGTSQTVGYQRNVVISSLGKMSKDQFDARMKMIEAEYAPKKHREGWKFLYEAISVSPEIKIFHRLEDDNENTQISRAIEGYRWSNGFVISMVANATDAETEKAESAAMTRKLGDDVPQKIALLTQMLVKVEGRDASEIPKVPGFCFDGGFLPGRAGEGKELEIDEELGAAFFGNKQFPDVGFDFETSTSFKEDSTLLQGGDLDKLLASKNAKVLRKGSVALPGISDTEEWLVYGDTDYGILVKGKQARGHYFKILGNPKTSSTLTPRVEFVMRTGGVVTTPSSDLSVTSDSSLSNAQALALWDAISKSIRLREGQK
jgi:Tle cognate immunity protein 4 C-terminal domain/Tle cognate immunity protein 4 N-terminal domain